MLGDVYYRIDIRNFSIYYVIIGRIMEVRWFRYSPSMQPLREHPRYESSDPLNGWRRKGRALTIEDRPFKNES